MRMHKAGEVRVSRCRNRAIGWPASVTGLGKCPGLGVWWEGGNWDSPPRRQA